MARVVMVDTGRALRGAPLGRLARPIAPDRLITVDRTTRDGLARALERGRNRDPRRRPRRAPRRLADPQVDPLRPRRPHQVGPARSVREGPDRHRLGRTIGRGAGRARDDVLAAALLALPRLLRRPEAPRMAPHPGDGEPSRALRAAPWASSAWATPGWSSRAAPRPSTCASSATGAATCPRRRASTGCMRPTRARPSTPSSREADVLALVLNLSDATHHLIGARELGLMKPSAIIVNLARGGVIDQDALIAALQDGRSPAPDSTSPTRAAAAGPSALGRAERADHAALHRRAPRQDRPLARHHHREPAALPRRRADAQPDDAEDISDPRPGGQGERRCSSTSLSASSS